MNEYQVILSTGKNATYHADSFSACMAKVELWEELSEVVEVRKVKRLPRFDKKVNP